MSLAGFRKQLNKANQFVNEKIGGAEGTKLDDEYIQCEKQIDIMSKLIEDIINKTHEYLHPNPATRARMVTMNTFNKMQGKAQKTSCAQPEGLLGECMIKYGNELGSESLFGECLVQAGNSFKCMEDVKLNMGDQVNSSYIEPLRGIQTVELKEINFHRKKLEGRRLDFDCKKRKRDSTKSKDIQKQTAQSSAGPGGGKLIEDEVKVAEQKFQESKVLAENSMANFLSSDLEHISALSEFIDAQVSYYRQSTEILETLYKYLMEKKDEAINRGKQTHTVKPVEITRTLSGDMYSSSNNGLNSPATPIKTGTGVGSSGPCCRALYQFEAENDSELPFSEGDIIQLINQVDENWFEGKINDKVGFFPVNYVQVIDPLPLMQ